MVQQNLKWQLVVSTDVGGAEQDNDIILASCQK